MEVLQLGEIKIEIVQKDIKNLHLSVYPPMGRVKIAAPAKMSLDTIRIYAISKLSWIKKQQEKIRSQKREAPREYLNKESHYFLGKRYQLKVIENVFQIFATNTIIFVSRSLAPSLCPCLNDTLLLTRVVYTVLSYEVRLRIV